MDQILQDILGTQRLLDNMIITGQTEEEHLTNLESVLKRLEERGLHKTQEKMGAVVGVAAETIHRTDTRLPPVSSKPGLSPAAPQSAAREEQEIVLDLIDHKVPF